MRRVANVTRALLLPTMLLLGLWTYSRSFDGFSYAGTRITSGVAPPLILTDDRGGTFDLAAQRGAVVLVYFGYTNCPDTCPATLDLIDNALQRLGPESRLVRTVFVTLDPRRDTPPALHAFLANFTPAPIGLTGPPDAVANIVRAWGVISRAAENGAYFDHTSLVAVVGPDGRERLRYGFSQLGDPDAVARDVRHVLHGG